MSEAKPTVYILRGDDRQAIKENLLTFIDRLGTPDLAATNTIRLEGGSTTLNDLQEAAFTMPFLSDRRLVIVNDALKLLSGRGSQKDRTQFINLLDSLPQTTALVLVLPDTKRYKAGEWKWNTVNERHWLFKWLKHSGNRAFLIDCALPTDNAMPNWIQKKASDFGGEFKRDAAQILTAYVGTNTERAAQEINKLLTFVNFERPVESDDVRRLTAQEQQGDIFNLVEAIGNRDGKTALEMLHILLAESDAIQIFGMIIRQFRLIIQAREIYEEGGNESDIARLLNQPFFIARKISAQARKFDLAALESIYQRLLEIDLGMKTGEMDGNIALDVLIARLAKNII